MRIKVCLLMLLTGVLIAFSPIRVPAQERVTNADIALQHISQAWGIPRECVGWVK